MFDFKGKIKSKERYGSGHINETYLVTTTEMKYILQKIDTNIFKKPEELMENILNVTDFIRNKIEKSEGDVNREVLNVVKDVKGKPYFKDGENFFRSYVFVEDTLSFDKVENGDDFYKAAVAFGKFQDLLSDYPSNTLFETIPDFHNTVKRLEKLKLAVKEDSKGRVNSVQKEIDFFLERENEAGILVNMLNNKELPLRVTHNDTKLNNVLFDKNTREALCVVDLDTVMPGLSVNDYGDAIRFGANTTFEDDPNSKNAGLDLTLFEHFTKGFLEGVNGKLTKNEIKMLPMAAKLMTYECGMRFLTDHIEGDHYYRISRENHNLDRARTQIEMIKDMEVKMDLMKEIVYRYADK